MALKAKNYDPLLMQNAAVDFPSDMTIGGSAVVALGTITSASANALTVGLAGATNPAFNVDSSTGSQAAGFNIIGATSAGTVAAAVISSGANASLTLDAKGTGTLGINTVATNSGLVTIGNSTSLAGALFYGLITVATPASLINTPIVTHTPTAINSSATATAAQVKTGYITSTSAAATTITLPTGTLLGAALGASQGYIHELYIDNTAGSSTVTIAVAANGIKSDAANTTAGSFGQLTVASGVTGQARFTLMFSSATAYTFTRTA